MTYSLNEESRVELNKTTSIEYHLLPLKQWLLDEDITEICINRPHEVFIERCNGVWERFQEERLTFDHLMSMATSIACYVGQDISDTRPILSADLSHGKRIQIVLPPACESDTISITIRKPS